MQSPGHAGSHSIRHREKTIKTHRQFEAIFVGSFYAIDQLPKDRRAQVAIAGRSNVGKSSLLNRLLGKRKKLAKVSATPGKTQSLNYYLINGEFYLVDLPGYGYARASRSAKAQWGKLIEDYLTGGKNLVGLLLLLDCRRETTDKDRQLLAWLAERELPVLVAITKSDKLSRDKIKRKVQQVEEELGLDAIPFSVVSGLGKNDLIAAVRELANTHAIIPREQSNG